MIHYSMEQLIETGRAMSSSVSSTAYVKTEEVSDSLCSSLQTVLGEDLKRVHIAAKPLNADDKKKIARSHGRNRWVIILETVCGKYLTVDLQQIDPEGNTIVIVKAGITNPVKGKDSHVLDSEGNLVPVHELGQLPDYAYSQCDELHEGLDVRSFFNRIEGFGLSRFKLHANSVPKIPEAFDKEGNRVCDVDYRGHRSWIWFVLRIVVPEMPNFIPDYCQSALMKLKYKNAPDADADDVVHGHFLPLKQKKDIMDNKPPKPPRSTQPSQSSVTLSSPHQSKGKERATPDEKSSCGDDTAEVSTQYQGHRHGTEPYGFTGAAPPLTQQGLSSSRWAVQNDRVNSAESSAPMFSQDNNSGSSNGFTGAAPPLTRQGLSNSRWGPQNDRANSAQSSTPMVPQSNDSGSVNASTQQSPAAATWTPENRRSNPAESLAPALSPVNYFASHVASDESVVEAVQGWNSYTQELDGVANDVDADPNPAWLRTSDNVNAFSQPAMRSSSNVGATDAFGPPSRQLRNLHRDAADGVALPESTGSFDNNLGVSNPFGSPPPQQPQQQQDEVEVAEASSQFLEPFGNVGVTNPFGSSSEQSHQDSWW